MLNRGPLHLEQQGYMDRASGDPDSDAAAADFRDTGRVPA